MLTFIHYKNKAMKTKKLLILLLSLNLLISCDSDDDFTKIENYLIGGVWKLESTERFYYYDDKFDRSEVFVDTTNSNKLTFNKDYSVIYEPSSMTTKLNGNWELKEDETYLLTDLSYTSGSSTGYRTFYYFPRSKIIEVNQNILLLESKHDISLYYSASTGNIKVTSFVRSTFLKE